MRGTRRRASNQPNPPPRPKRAQPNTQLDRRPARTEAPAPVRAVVSPTSSRETLILLLATVECRRRRGETGCKRCVGVGVKPLVAVNVLREVEVEVGRRRRQGLRLRPRNALLSLSTEESTRKTEVETPRNVLVLLLTLDDAPRHLARPEPGSSSKSIAATSAFVHLFANVAMPLTNLDLMPTNTSIGILVAVIRDPLLPPPLQHPRERRATQPTLTLRPSLIHIPSRFFIDDIGIDNIEFIPVNKRSRTGVRTVTLKETRRSRMSLLRTTRRVQGRTLLERGVPSIGVVSRAQTSEGVRVCMVRLRMVVLATVQYRARCSQWRGLDVRRGRAQREVSGRRWGYGRC